MGSDASLFFLHCAEVEAVSEPWEDTCGAEIYRGEIKGRFLFLLQGLKLCAGRDSDAYVQVSSCWRCASGSEAQPTVPPPGGRCALRVGPRWTPSGGGVQTPPPRRVAAPECHRPTEGSHDGMQCWWGRRLLWTTLLSCWRILRNSALLVFKGDPASVGGPKTRRLAPNEEHVVMRFSCKNT
jgi:hypothetical protein